VVAQGAAGAKEATVRFNVLRILGVIFLLVGIGVVVTNLDDTPSGEWRTVRRRGRTVNYMQGGGLLIMGGTFVFVGVIMTLVGSMAARAARATAQLLAAGLAGKATITGLTQTGMYLNRNPQISMDLMVDVPGRAPYPVKHREFVPLMVVGRLTAGAPLSVRVDPANPQRIAIDWSSSVFAASPRG
jgi:hypothetical protein